jgi:hypothetical protein
LKKLLCAAIVLVISFSATAQNNFKVLSKWLAYTDIENSLYHYFSDMAFDSLELRKNEIASLKTKADWIERQLDVKKTLHEIVGTFPEKTPLNPKVTGILYRPEFRVEKIIFESQPNFYVTGCLFIPSSLKSPGPAVIYCSGHTADGFRSKTYQNVILNLALKGFVVFAFDPVGQGERIQYLDPATGESAVGGATNEHSYPGAQCFIAGSSVAKHMIWDGIRSVDYLLTRPEIDPNRIGITGRSGGGTQSSYIAAFDERIYAAAPECYITNFTRLIQSMGPQDAEQNFRRGIQSGIDHGDLIEVRAPKPTLLIGTTRDFFSIQGLGETYEEANLAFKALGHDDHLQLTFDDSSHASTQKNRESMCAFFQHHLGLPGDAAEAIVEPFESEELDVTSSGQLGSSLKGETIFSLNKKAAQTAIRKLEAERVNANHLEHVKAKIIELKPQKPSPVIFTGRTNHKNYSIEKYFMDKTNYVIPFVIIKPLAAKKIEPLLWLSGSGKETAGENWSSIMSMIDNGWSVVLPDLIGVGECGPGDFRGDAYTFKQGVGAYNIWFFGIQMGQPIVRLWANDVLELQSYLRSRNDVSAATIPAIAEGLAGPALQQAAVIEETIAPIILINSLTSYQSIIENEFYSPELMHAVDPFALPDFDLPDLNAALAPRDLCIINPIDHSSISLKKECAQESFEYESSIYDHYPTSRFKIIVDDSTKNEYLNASFFLGQAPH